MKKQRKWRVRVCSRMTWVLVGMLAFNGTTSAQWIVEDPAAIAKMVQEYIETAKRWKQSYDHYQQQLIKFKKLTSMVSDFSDSFAERDANYGMKMACPGSESVSFDPREILRQTLPDLKGDIVEEQRKICQRIVLAENNKYNDTVQVMKTLIQRQKEMQAIELQRAGTGTSQGALAANDNEVQRLLARTTMDLQYWQSRITAYDGYISTLKMDSDRLAKCAMRGCANGLENLIGNVVQAATLKAALSGSVK